MDWPARLDRLGIDVISSGVVPDTDASLAAARGAAPYRPVKAVGTEASLSEGAWLVEGAPVGDVVAIDPEHVLVAQDGLQFDDANDVAAMILDAVRDNPAHWWVAARGLGDADPADVDTAITALVEGTKFVRLYLSKQQFDGLR